MKFHREHLNRERIIWRVSMSSKGLETFGVVSFWMTSSKVCKNVIKFEHHNLSTTRLDFIYCLDKNYKKFQKFSGLENLINKKNIFWNLKLKLRRFFKIKWVKAFEASKPFKFSCDPYCEQTLKRSETFSLNIKSRRCSCFFSKFVFSANICSISMSQGCNKMFAICSFGKALYL